eukprot:TRINITY_DN121101_c0_g1_i1.p1 TRINITY_DN121101_c0_g1~~TRINITY_DN121101_c0_g1_i1.p1  ORF type:complete len:448 (-),score=48.30 TRINITY_DN121101_c0_g1_i1:145-1488(-)
MAAAQDRCAVEERVVLLKSLGNGEYKSQQYSRAISLYRAADAIAERRPHFKIVLASNLAACYLKLGESSLAAKCAESGLALGAEGDLKAKLEGRQAEASKAGPAQSTDMEDFDSVRSEGNKQFCAGNFLAAKQTYESLLHHDAQDVNRLKAVSNLALTYLKLGLCHRASFACEEGVRVAASLEGDDVKVLLRKLESRKRAAKMLEHVVDNYIASLQASPASPTRLPAELCREVISSASSLFLMGQFLEARDDSRFLCTVGVLTCIAIFAWSPESKVRGFGAHVPVGAVLHGCLRRRMGSSCHTLEEMVKALKAAFEGTDPSKVEVHVLGGHAVEDGSTALASVYFKGDPQRSLLSWHIIDAVRSAGFSRINTALLNVFPGAPCESMEIEMRLRQENQRFVLAALDLETGNIVTHSEHATDPVPSEWWRRDSMNFLTPGGQPMKHARA